MRFGAKEALYGRCAGRRAIHAAMKKGDHLFLIDGSGFIFRAFHALPPLTRKSDGLPVGAVSGFCNMLWKLLTDARDTDGRRDADAFRRHLRLFSKTFRKDLYADYKANRSAPPEELIPQFGLIRQATRAFNLPCIETEGFEADDIIATYARQAEAAGADVTIVSSDKDLMQLVSADVHMYDSMKDKQIGIPEVIEKWGVPPEKMIDLQAMTGDSVDNVPGIPGIGPKTAAQLLEEYGDLDTLLARAGEIKQEKRRENDHRQRRQGAPFTPTGDAADRRAAGPAARGSRPGSAERPEADRLPEGDGIHHADAPRCGGLRCDADAIDAGRRARSNGATAAHGPDLDAVSREPVAGGIPDMPGGVVGAVPAEPNAGNGGEASFCRELVKARAELSPPAPSITRAT